MSEEEILKKMNNDKYYRAETLIKLNVALKRTQRYVARVEDLQEVKEFKIAVVSLESENAYLQQENQKLKSHQKEFIEHLENKIVEYETYDRTGFPQDAIIANDLVLHSLRCTLSKYLKTIGVKDEKEIR